MAKSTGKKGAKAPVKAKRRRKRTKPVARQKKKLLWSPEDEKRLSELFPTATWEELFEAFPGRSRGGINSKARLMCLSRPRPEQLKAKTDGEPTVTDEELAQFMTRGRSAQEIAKQFGLPDKQVVQRFVRGIEGYDIFLGPHNVQGEQTYVAVPSVGNFRVAERSWEWRQSNVEGQPYGAVIFPDDFNHRKIRIIPLDGILFGHRDHDAERFDAVVNAIARTPNTFCFLNGDIIGEVPRGKKDERHQVLLDRTADFEKKVKRIAHKILWAQQGCLEEKCLRMQIFDPLQHFCDLTGIPYFREPVYVDIWWKGQLFTLWTMHGHSTAQLKGTKMNTLRRPAQVHEFTHFICMGHVGDAMWNRPIKLVRKYDEGMLKHREEFHVILGNFKRYFGTREARRGHPPPSNETVVLYLYPDGNHHVKTIHGSHGRKR
ncbi:hypothetical protein AMJ57_03525 [Parcubacteria bacterium SG8_24]|nr:MAG: hypothetical protein AMJ57_03525 [Parcubacteria bacterium SG8_24]